MSNRIERINSLLQRSISEIINNEINDPRIQGIISVSRVVTSQDLKHARIFLSIYNTVGKEITFDAIKSASGYIKKILAHKIDFRTVPDLIFELDDTAQYSQKINEILNSLKDK